MCFCKVKKTVFAAKFYDSIDFYNETFPLYTVHTVLCTVSNLSDAFCPRGVAIELSEWLPVRAHLSVLIAQKLLDGGMD